MRIEPLAMILRVTFIVLLLNSFTSVPAQDGWALSVFFENDLFSDTDESYTNGVKLSLVSPDISRYADKVPAWSKGVVSVLPFVNVLGDDVQKNIGLSLGQSIYTPRDISDSELIPDDRPYAGWLYFGVAFHSKTERGLDTLELQVGIVGPSSLAEDAQKIVHEVRDLQNPNGWPHQLNHELGLNFFYDRKYRLITSELSNYGLGYDVIFHSGVSLGNVRTDVNVGIESRVGWNLPKDFGTPTIRPTGNILATNQPKESSLSVYFFAGTEGRAVIHDIFLDGNTFEDSHSIDKKHFVGDFSLGVSVRWQDIKLSYAHLVRSREFEGQADLHAFGSMTLTYFF